MIVFSVFKEGVYNHGNYGVFDSLELAVAAADKTAAADYDDYHRYEVFSCELNKIDGWSDIHYVTKHSKSLAKLAVPA